MKGGKETTSIIRCPATYDCSCQNIITFDKMFCAMTFHDDLRGQPPFAETNANHELHKRLGKKPRGMAREKNR
jgi:hypothetical protein